MLIQSEDHPSPDEVFWSSHISSPITIPSPQIGAHSPGDPDLGPYPVGQAITQAVLSELGISPAGHCEQSSL